MTEISHPAEVRQQKRRKSAWLQRAEYALYRIALRIARTPREEKLLVWGTRLGALAQRLLPRRNRIALRNLREAFPDKSERERMEILNNCWRHFGREALLYLHAQSLPLDAIAERCPFVNEQLLEESIARGNGTVLISAHWGGWEIAGLALMSLVDNVRTVARKLDNDYLERDLARYRARTGAEVIDRRKAARPLMKGLSENAVVVLLPDQSVLPREGVLVPFLGRAAWTTPAPAKMALRQGSSIVFAFCIPDGTRHRLEFTESIRTDELTDADNAAVALTARINDVLSRRIAARPELWLWMHDRWKGTGAGEGGRTNVE
jgi:KDO2-lipid IV(A) lauroyltransferase